MDRIKNYNIAFGGLKNGKHEFDFDITQEFFDLFATEPDFCDAKLQATAAVDKHSTFLEMTIRVEGEVSLACDITGRQFLQPVENGVNILVKFGEEYDDSNEEIITLPHGETEVNIAQQIYEAALLAIPMKKVSPDVTDEDLDLLERYSPGEESEEAAETPADIDPRWAALNKLKKEN